MVEKSLVLLNPAAGRGRGQQLRDQIRSPAPAAHVEVETPATAEDTERRAREAALAGYTRVIAAGGDGTAHYVLNGLAGTNAALGIIPCGSGNDLAVNLSIPLDIPSAATLAFSGPARAIDLCRLQPSGRHYACIACFGLDAHANKIANHHRGPFRGTSLYAYALFRSLLFYRSPKMTITHDSLDDPEAYTGRVMLLAAANAPSYGGGMRIAPLAKVHDGRLDLVIVARMSRLKLLRCFPEVFTGKHMSRKEVTYLRCTRARIEADRPLDIYADGEPAGQTPADVEVLPGALRVIAGI